jgi:hypothetical protein
VKLGNDTIGLRKSIPRVDGGGQPVRDEYGDRVVDALDVEVPWCLVTRRVGWWTRSSRRTGPRRR